MVGNLPYKPSLLFSRTAESCRVSARIGSAVVWGSFEARFRRVPQMFRSLWDGSAGFCEGSSARVCKLPERRMLLGIYLSLV